MSDTATVLGLKPAPAHLAADRVLRRIKELSRTYGRRLDGVVLYGSRARGDERPDSDIDLLVVLKEPIDWPKERWRLAELAADIGLETDEAPSFLIETEEALAHPSLFLQNVLEDRVLL